MTGDGDARRKPLAMLSVGFVLVLLMGIVVLVRTTGNPAAPGPTDTPSRTPSAATTATSAAPRPGVRRTYPAFAADSIFARDVGSAPVDPSSAALMATVRGQITSRYGGVAAFNIWAYNASLFTATAQTPVADVAFDDCQGKGSTPAGLYDGQAHFARVPIPPDAVPATGTDAELSIWSPERDQLWEFWKARKRDDGTWQACWGGRIDDVSRSNGQFPAPYGVVAAGVSVTGLMITLEEARAGKIEHALGLAVVQAAKGRFRYPANRTDGRDASAHAIPEGSRLRLDPTFEVETSALTPMGKAIAKAAQTYGFIVIDQAGAVAVIGEAAHAEKLLTGRDGWVDALGGQPSYAQLKGFPWDRVSVVLSPQP